MKTRKFNTLPVKTILSIFVVMLFAISHSSAQNQTEILSGEEVHINSKILNEERVISVYLPNDYDLTSVNYPVLYLLDGRTHFQHATGAVNFLSAQGIIPQMIVVSIHNVDRSRDFSPVYTERIPDSGGAEKFLNFLSDELISYINENYRASSFTVLLGHSFGGTFAAYSLLTKPEVFDAYIAVSPYIQYADNHLIEETKQLLKSSYNSPKYFYMTVGNEPNYFPVLEEFSKLVTEKAKTGLAFKYVKMEDENHASIPYISLFNGLRFTFSGWQLPDGKLDEGLAAIDEHYRNISRLYDFETQTPENIINRLGYNYLQNGDTEKAIEVFLENVKRYPKSANVYDSLGEAYENNDQLELARKNYQIAFELGTKLNDRNTPIYKTNLDRVSEK